MSYLIVSGRKRKASHADIRNMIHIAISIVKEITHQQNHYSWLTVLITRNVLREHRNNFHLPTQYFLSLKMEKMQKRWECYTFIHVNAST